MKELTESQKLALLREQPVRVANDVSSNEAEFAKLKAKIAELEHRIKELHFEGSYNDEE